MFKKVVAAMLVVPMFLMYAGGLGAVSAEESTELKYACVGEVLRQEIDVAMDVEINAGIPDSVEPETAFTVDNSYTNISLTLENTDLLGLIAPLQGEVTTFNLGLTNATDTETGEDVVNVASEDIPIGPVEIPEGADSVDFRVPAEGGIDLNLTSGESGTVEIEAGTIMNTVYALDGAVPVEVTCNPAEGQDLVLNEIPIEEEDTV